MNNKTVNMNLTPQEVLIIESLRACQAANATVNGSVEPQKTQDQTFDFDSWNPRAEEEMMEKYMNMNEVDFMNEYVEAVGADVILDVLCDTMPAREKWNAIWDAIDEDVIDELFASYVSDDTRCDMFFELNDRYELAAQLVSGWI
jgi:hypothetical protein